MRVLHYLCKKVSEANFFRIVIVTLLLKINVGMVYSRDDNF